MTKSELIYRLTEIMSNKHYLSLEQKDIEPCIKTLVDTMSQSLSKGQRIEIRGFGSFDLNYRPARVGRNPKTGDSVKVPEKYTPHFKPGKDLRERVNASKK